MVNEKQKKLFVPDTNVIMHKFNCVYDFEEHDVDIITPVLEELDHFKKGNETVNVNVREFHRILDKFRSVTKKQISGKGSKATEKTVSALFYGGVSLGEALGNIEIKSVPRKLNQKVKELFYDETPDHRILSAIFLLQAEELKGKKRRVILVTKDINLRLKATALGIEVEDYENDKVPSVDHLYMGKGELNDDSFDILIAKLYNDGKALIFDQEYSKAIDKDKIKPNMFFVIKSQGKGTCLARVDKNMEYFHRIEKMPVSGITPLNSEQAFSVSALTQTDISLVTLLGKAGTGKTLLAMASAIQQCKEEKYEKIIVAAAMVPLSNKDIGALPGDANEKVSPYMQGLFDNLEFIKSQNKGPKVKREVEEENINSSKKRKPKNASTVERVDYITAMQKDGKIKIQPLASIRGRSLNNVYFIIDEAQNLTPHEVKTIITRAGKNTKVVFCGDVMQIDSPYLDARSNGLSHSVYKLAGKKIVAHVTLEKGERSELAELAADLL